MCGICGFVNKTETADIEVVRRMTATLRHRGPDYAGATVAAQVGLGHARLSIIDLSESGNQPMCNEDRTVWLVFNGEIYNFQELKVQLEAKGHLFRSHSDSEVIIHLWEEEGPDCLNRLNGMFALAIWDEKSETLFLARDRIGKKPLFYTELPDGNFVFGSEIKALQAYPSFRPEPDMHAIHYYLSFQSVPAPYCAFKGVKKLSPAHYLTYRKGCTAITRYWQLSYDNQFVIKTANDETALQEEIICRLQTAIKKRMVSDVPLGAFLSGGLDSSLITALMAGMSEQPIRTFSIGFEEKDHDETAYAKMVAERYHTDHTVLEVRPQLLEIIDDLVWHYNEPFADSSAIPTFYLSKLASEKVSVVLTGDAGDENFAGYQRYINSIDPVEKFPGYKLLVAMYMNYRRFGFFNNRNCTWLENMNRQRRIDPRKNSYYFRITHFHEQYQSRLYTPQMWNVVGKHASVDFMLDKYDQFAKGDFIDKTLGVDMTMYMSDTLMVKTDIAAMAYGLEARCPMLDHEFVEFAARIPSRLKLKDNRISKYILKKASEKYLPNDVIYRPKMGFGVPFNHWLRNNGKIKDFTYDILLDKNSFISEWFNIGYVRELLDRHQKNLHENWQYLIWNLLFLELWHRKFFRGKTWKD